MITVKNLHKGFNGVPILKGISTTFEQGKTNLIIGQSGSGKTVFLKSLLGLHTPEEGTISFHDKVYGDLSKSKKRKLRVKIGMLFQGGALFDSMTVEENVLFPMEMFSQMSDSEKRDRANEVIKRVALINSNHKFPSEISGGMQKRVAIARAIVMNPKYLFCDEPNSGLDPQTSILIDNLILEITQEYNITTVINSHDMNSVMEIGQNIVFLKNGLKEWEGTNQDIFRTDNKAVTDFVYSSNLMKKVRTMYLEGN
ncbi:MAG: ATP-binding cassette domain-containing protein [Flavobacteriaceae bacterium]|nr:ATP-binding cassette domain-containing protein [Flavobacteriaceae bacterium]